MKKYCKLILIIFALTLMGNLFSGCAFEPVGLVITNYPKLVYQKGETFSTSGLKLEIMNANGVLTRTYINDNNISQIDMSTSGEKQVVIKKDNLKK